MIRRLRIAASVFFAILSVALVILWVRSYWARDSVWGWFPFPAYLQFTSESGRTMIIATSERHKPMLRSSSVPADSPPIPGFPLPSSPPSWYFSIDTHAGNLNDMWFVDIRSPHWFVAILTSAVAILTWTRWQPSFSLRTMLIVTTLIAAALGAVVILTH
jgi:hypothetical protein